MRASSSVSLISLVCVVVLALPGCRKAGSNPTSPDAGGADKQYDDPLAELDALERQMRGMGLAVSASQASPTLSEEAGESEKADVDADGEATMAPAAEASAGGDERAEDEAPMPAPTAADSTSSRTRQVEQCGNICDLSEAICDLEVRICSLSESHRGERTYADACRRASDDCEVAGHECDRCE